MSCHQTLELGNTERTGHLALLILMVETGTEKRHKKEALKSGQNCGVSGYPEVMRKQKLEFAKTKRFCLHLRVSEG